MLSSLNVITVLPASLTVLPVTVISAPSLTNSTGAVHSVAAIVSVFPVPAAEATQAYKGLPSEATGVFDQLFANEEVVI